MRFQSALHAFCVLFLSSFVQWVNAVTLVKGPEVKVESATATVTWTTDVAAGTRLSYGTTQKQLDQRLEGGVAAEHRIEIKDLKQGQTYFFSIGTARVPLATGTFSTGGSAATSTVVVDGKLNSSTPQKPSNTVVTKPAPTPLPKPPATGLIWGNLGSLQDHFNRHGPDFRSTSPDDYAAKAWLFLEHAKRDGLPMKWDDTDQTLRVWEGSTRTFAAYDRHGKARTFFKPSNPDYWNRQPGRSVRPAELRF
jgi:hypothetical protein